MMEKTTQLILFLTILLMTFQAFPTGLFTLNRGQLSKVIRVPGVYNSPNGKCQISLNISDQGGFIQLLLQPKEHQHKVVNDVTGATYFLDDSLVYTTSPVYGNPGVFIYNCVSKKIKQVVAPKNIDEDYPQGADYFELHALEGDKIYFYYSSDVDRTDFNSFRTKDFLFEVLVDGSALKKTR